MIEKKIKILDCTLRDGGYYNKWEFTSKVVDRYLKAVVAANVDIVELGFRSIISKNNKMGPYFYTTDQFIKTLDLPDGPQYGVMINGKEFVGNQENKINELFQIKEKSPITLVRIAINFDNSHQVEAITRTIKSLGYKVGLNLMQANGKKIDEYIKIAKMIKSWGSVDVLYFADSLGNMSPDNVEKICKSIKQGWEGPLGIHTHNNKNLALINSIVAIQNGTTWCDSTITGMGRGAGNVSTESLILEASSKGFHNGDAKMTQPAVEDFTVMQKQYGWGSNLYYHYAANNNIHPTFVQLLLEDKRYNNRQILDALEFLSNRNATAYSIDALRQAIYGNQKETNGTWNAAGWLNKKEALIIGAGTSVKKYNNQILQYINKVKPSVIFLNINRYLPNSVGTATVVSNVARSLFDAKQYHSLTHPIILPEKRFGSLIKEQLKGKTLYDYGLSIKKGSFKIDSNNCELQWPLAAAYALALVTTAKASKISLVGFDGYSDEDPRQQEMDEVFTLYKTLSESLNIFSLTPTKYNIEKDLII